MTFSLSRRSFGLMTFGAACLPALGLAQGAGFANPDLLMAPEALRRQLDLNEGLRPAYEAAGIVLVDVRPLEAFSAGHIPGARHLDPNAVATDAGPVEGMLRPIPEIEMILGGLGITPEARVVFYDDRGGFHAARMFWLMEYLGHRRVALLDGGMTAWREFGGLERIDPMTYQAADFTGALTPRRLATADYILAHQGDNETVVVDVRPPELFAQGHIPWAINLPWSQNLAEDQRFRSAQALEAHFAQHGVTPDRNVVIHCQTGLASSHSYVGLRLLGYPRLRVYHRSWAEWGSDPSLPQAIG